MSFGWIFGIVGTLGIAGTVALALLAPTLAASLWKAAADAVIYTFERLSQTRGGVAAMTAAGCLLFGYFYFDHVGYSRCHDAWRTANAEAAEKVVKADAAAAAKAKTIEDKATAAEQAADAKNAEGRNAYIADLEKRAASVCTDSDADIKRLLRKTR